MADNTITVVGNLTRDPEIRYTGSGQANARLDEPTDFLANATHTIAAPRLVPAG